MIWPRCGSDNKSGEKFCTECGEKLAQKCPNCQSEVGADDKFCGECGSQLGAAAAPPPKELPPGEEKPIKQ